MGSEMTRERIAATERLTRPYLADRHSDRAEATVTSTEPL